MKVIITSLGITVLFIICTLQTVIAQNIFPANGNVGIGTLAPASALQVIGGTRLGSATNYIGFDANGNLTFTGGAAYKVANNKYAFQAAANTLIGLYFNATAGALEYRNSIAANVFSVNLPSGNGYFSGRLGIGNATPGAKLDVAGNIKIVDGTQGTGKVLTSDSAGLASWQMPAVTNPFWTVSGNNIYNANIGNVGIGTAIPVQKLDVNGDALINGITIGRGAGAVSTNTANGYLALYSNTTGSYNTASGYQALYRNTSGVRNTANGSYALSFNTTGGFNIATGDFALFSNTDGHYNTATGNYTLNSNTIGSFNTATGYSALYNNIAGSYNTANGHYALYNTTGSYNTANGSYALYKNTTGSSNTANGNRALYENITGYRNTAIGEDALHLNTNGFFNTANGYNCLYNNTDGYGNTAIGYGADVTTNNLTNAMALGYTAMVNASNKITVGNNNVSVIGGQVGWSILSDGRFKSNIKENVPGLNFINKLKPVTYNLELEKFDKFVGKKDSLINANKADYAFGEKIVHTGFIAQDVEKAAQELQYDFDGVNHPQNDKDNYSIIYADFVPSLVKAVQQLSKQNDDLKKEVEDLKSIIMASQAQRLAVTASAQSSPQVVELGMAARLEQNIPNPFENSTTISYYLPANNGNAYINFYSSNGSLLKSIKLTANGKGSVDAKANQLPSGVYKYALVIDGKVVDSKQMVQVK